MIEKCFLFLVVISISIAMQGQNVNPLDGQYTPPKTSIFSGNSNALNSKNGFAENPCYNKLRLSVLDFARSEVRLLYERKFGRFFSATIGYGRAYGKDNMEAETLILVDDFRHEQTGGSGLVGLRERSLFKSGYSLSTTVKCFVKEDDPMAYFVELGNKYVNVKNQSLSSAYGTSVSDQQFEVRLNHMSLGMGCQWTYGGGKVCFTHELSGGMGVKFYSWDKFLPIMGKDPHGYDVIYDFKTDQRLSSKNVIFFFRYQMGIGW